MHDSSKLLTGLKFKQTLRYGENPQQQATWCVYPDHGLSSANQLQGKELSYKQFNRFRCSSINRKGIS